MEDSQQKEFSALCWLAHFYPYTLASYCSLARDSLNKSRFLSSNNRGSSLSNILERASERYLAIAVIFALFQERVKGKFPTWEGILLVRERKKGTE